MGNPGSHSILGIDIGGTFTDFVLLHDGRIEVHKRLTTPEDPSVGMLAGIETFAPKALALVIHGSTIATNALLERRGAKIALVVTKGFADILEIGRQNRPDLYALVPHRPPPLVPRERQYEIDERVSAEGEVLTPLTSQDIDALVFWVRQQEVESVAVCLLHSFKHVDHEKIIGDALQPVVQVSLSSEILPEFREFERASTTAINAYVSPLVSTYLTRVEAALDHTDLLIMQSNGGVISAAAAKREASRTVLSGPAGGAVGAHLIAEMAGFDHIISFDMGGTSTDVALFPGHIPLTYDTTIDGMPLRLPVVDIHTVGAGGGSIAGIDIAGALRVGPSSAGADPGPVCYGRGGTQPTTTDANLVLGRLHADHFLGGAMRLDRDAAANAYKTLALEMGVSSPEAAALGVVQVANAAMGRAIRTISIERGYDPRDFTLISFGGAGPLHACELARDLGIPRVLVPSIPGVLSALGMAMSDIVRDYSQTVLADQDMLDALSLEAVFEALEGLAWQDIRGELLSPEQIEMTHILDIRYVGQSHEISVPQSDAGWLAGFHQAHEKRFGHLHDQSPVEIVTARLHVVGRRDKVELRRVQAGTESAEYALVDTTHVWFGDSTPVHTPVYMRDRLLANNVVIGPSLVVQMDSTLLILPDWEGVVDTWGNILLTQ